MPQLSFLLRKHVSATIRILSPTKIYVVTPTMQCYHYFARGSGCEVLWWMCVWVCVCVSVCLSVCEDISGTTNTIFTKFLVHVAYVRGSVLLRHVDDRPHRLSAGSWWRECTARAKSPKCNLRLPCWELCVDVFEIAQLCQVLKQLDKTLQICV